MRISSTSPQAKSSKNGGPFDLAHYRMPAEWELHEATWLAWPKNTETWPEELEAVQDIWVRMIEVLCPHEKVYVLVDDEEMANEVRFKTGKILEGLTNIFPTVIPTTDAWLRDSGPIFLVAKKPKRTAGAPNVIIQDFIFNNWGKKYPDWEADDRVPTLIGKKINISALKRILVLEGGSIDVNGYGAVLTTKQCLLNSNRNPNLSQTEIEEKLKYYLGVSHVLWLENGIEGDDTDGHVDDIARFVNPNTVAAAVEADSQDANHEPLQKNLQNLRKMKDQNGRPLNIVELPMPRRIDHPAFGRCPASYANFYIANKVVLVPTYSCPQDQQALETLQKLFPDRKIVGINCTPLIPGLGALHCVTQQQPVV